MRLVFWLKLTAVIAGMIVLTGCPGEKSDPQPQQPAPRVESTGTLTDGVALRAQPIVVETSQSTTRDTLTSSTGTFTMNMSGLTGPYMFSNSLAPAGNPDLIFLTSVATDVGPTNVTPLTTLLTAQLLGATPVNAFQAFSTSPPKDPITDDRIAAAQADLTTYLQDVLGVQVKSGTSSFIKTPFKTDVGDPMYDTILALNAKLAANNMSLGDLAARVATGAQACLTEKIQISIGGQQRKFCPVNKSDVPEEADTSILDYKFIDISNAVLLVKVRENTVLSVDLTTATNVTYSCVAAACTGISLGTPAEDQSRPIVFGSLPLTGSDSGALLIGTFIGPPPSIELPILPCSDNRFFAILSNHSVLADCIDPSSDPFNFGAEQINAPAHGQLQIAFHGQDPTTGAIKVTVDRTTFAPISVYFYTMDPDTFQITSRYVCYAEACKGVDWGTGTIENKSGYHLELRTITLDNTTLTGIDDDANPTGESLTLKLTGNAWGDPTQGDPDPEEPPPPPTYPPLADCADPAADTVSATGPEGEEFNLCLPQNDPDNGVFWRLSYDIGDGFMEVYYYNEAGDAVWVDVSPDGELTYTGAYVSTSGEQFNCTPPSCSGVTVSGPDENGGYVVSFSNTLLRTSVPPGQPPTHPRRTLAISSGDLIMPPPGQ